MRRSGLLRALLPTVIVALAVACARGAAVGRSDLLERMSAAFYSHTQSRLAETEEERGETSGRAQYPVLVVNLDGIRTDTSPVSGRPETSRPVLQALITALAAHHPAVIGVDIDLSPEVGNVARNGGEAPVTFTDPVQDPVLLWRCLQLTQKGGVPVFLGVHRTIAYPPDIWLGSSRYAPLAASLAVPNDEQRALWSWPPAGKAQGRCPFLSSAVAAPLLRGRDDVRPHPGWRWAVCQGRRERGTSEQAERFLVNYGALERLREDAVPYVEVLAGRLPDMALRLPDGHRKAALVGYLDTTAVRDSFIVPGHAAPVPGVLLHACAVDSLVRQPVYQLTLPGRLALDLIPAVLAIAAVIVVVSRTRGLSPEHVISRHRGWALLSLAGCFALTFGLVSRGHVAWDEFPLVLIGALWHPDIEHMAMQALRPLRARWRRGRHA